MAGKAGSNITQACTIHRQHVSVALWNGPAAMRPAGPSAAGCITRSEMWRLGNPAYMDLPLLPGTAGSKMEVRDLCTPHSLVIRS
jgi:hypothetical protein